MRAHWRLIAAAILVPLFSATLYSQQLNTDAPPTEREYLQQQANVQKLFAQAEYQKAADACAEMLKKFPNDAGTLYNLACAQARLKQTPEAINTLENAVKAGMSDADHIQSDDDLASLRGEKKFAEIVALAKASVRPTGKYEPGEDIPGVNTAEASPDGGLRYRLRIPKDATAEKPAGLIIWLHPSGASMNKQVEKLAPDFAAHGYALMVMTQKQFRSWTGQEIHQLVSKSLPDVKTHKEIDSTLPVLMGFSAGGQVAIMLWQQKPEAWSGVILDAAYPLIAQGAKYIPVELPPEPGTFKKTPMHVLVGGKDPGSKLWQQTEGKWLKAGVPLTLVTVPDQGHAWLLSGETLKQTYHWLDDVRTGKLPADAQAAATPATSP